MCVFGSCCHSTPELSDMEMLEDNRGNADGRKVDDRTGKSKHRKVKGKKTHKHKKKDEKHLK